MTSSKCPPNEERYSQPSGLLQHPVLRGELADLLSNHSPTDSLRGLRLLVLDHQLQQLLAGKDSAEVEQLVEHLGMAIQLAGQIDWKDCA